MSMTLGARGVMMLQHPWKKSEGAPPANVEMLKMLKINGKEKTRNLLKYPIYSSFSFLLHFLVVLEPEKNQGSYDILIFEIAHTFGKYFLTSPYEYSIGCGDYVIPSHL